MIERLQVWGISVDEGELWKVFVLEMTDRLDEGIIPLRENLKLLISSLEEAGAMRTVNLYVRPVHRLINSFGLHLARLDIRQKVPPMILPLAR